MALAAFALAACGPEAPESDGGRAAPPPAIGPAIREALAEASRLDRLRRLTGVLEFLDAENVDEAVAVYDRENAMLAEAEVQAFFDAWSRFDPISAVGHAASWPNRRLGGSAVAAAVQGWALREPQEAARAVEELLEASPQLRQELLSGLVAGWVHSGDPGVLEYVASGPERGRVFNSVTLVGAQTRRLGVPGVLRWADDVLDGLPDEKFRKEVFERVANQAAQRDPAAAAAWIDAHRGQGYGDLGVRSVAELWLPIDAEAALAWASKLPTEQERAAAIRSAFSQWLQRDFGRASEWLESAAAAPPPDPAIDAYVGVLARREPDAALRWAERMRDDDLRLASLTRVAKQWYRREPVAAEAWLQESPLDEETRLAVRQPPARKPRPPARRMPGPLRRQRAP
jgi:hypothetical protein